MSGQNGAAAPTAGANEVVSALALAAAAAAAAVAGVSAWEWLRSDERAGTCVALALALGALAILPWALGQLRGRFDMLEPPVVVGLIVVLAYVLPAFGMMADADISWALIGQNRAHGRMLTLLSPALALAILGFGSFLAAYYATAAFEAPAADRPAGAGRRDQRRPHVEVDPRRLRFWVAVFAAGSTASLLAFVVLVGGPGELLSRLNDRVRLFAGLNYLLAPVTGFMSLALVQYCRDLSEAGRVRWRVWAASGAAIAINLLQGSKTNVLATAFAFLAAHHYFRRRVSTAAALAAAAGAVVVAMAYDLYFREYLVIGDVVSIDLSRSLWDVVRLGWGAFSSNAFVQLPALMLMVDGMPDVLPFQLGRPYIALLLMPIPRAVFPAKPPVGTEIFSAAFFPDLLIDGTSMPTSLLGEFYFNFGPPGVIVGSMIAGVLARYAYRLVSRGRPGMWDVAIYGAFVATLFPWIRGDTFGPTVYFATLVGPVVLLRRLTAPRT